MTDPSTIPRSASLTASGIARLANVGRAAVSNWRRRYADFPSPVGGTPTSPSFDARQVEEWLRRHGRLHQAGTEQWAWRNIESYQPASEINDVLAICGAHLLAQADRAKPATDKLPAPQELLRHLRHLDPDLARQVENVLPKKWTPQLTTILRTVDQLSSELDPERAFEYLHTQFVSSAHSVSGLAGTPDNVAEVMLILAGPGALTFDFTSGTGSLLRMAADRASRSGADTRCFAQEINPQYALVTLLRLWFVHLRARRAGAEADPPRVHVGDSLLADAFPDLRADVVVANFPFGIHDWGNDRLGYDARWTYGLPPRTEPELAWVQHALAHLSPKGTAVVLMPPAAASRPAGRRIRAELIRRGALRAVIALPAGLMPPTNIGLHVWVLAQPDQRGPHLLVVDAAAAPAGRTFIEVVETAWQSYLSDGYAEEPGVHRAVPAVELLDDQVDVTPHRYLPHAGEPAADPAAIIAGIDDFNKLITQVQQSLPAVGQVSATPLHTAPQADIADLIRSGSISVQRAVARGRHGAAAVVLTPSDVLSGGPATGSTTRATGDQPGPQVRTGDILVPVIGHRITARVATADQVGAELGPGVQLIRVDQEVFDPWFVAGVISRTDNVRTAARTSSNVSGAVRLDIRRLSIPVLPLGQQQEYGRVFNQLADFRSHLERAATSGAALAREISDGLTAGTIGLESHPAG